MMNTRWLTLFVLCCFGMTPLFARNPKLLFNDSTLQSIRNNYNSTPISFPFDELRKLIIADGSVTSIPGTADGTAVYDESKAMLAKLLAFRYCVEANADISLGDRAFYWLYTKYVEDNYVYQSDNWSSWIENALALNHYCIAFDILSGAGYFDARAHPADPHDQTYWNGLQQAAAQRLHDKAAAIYNRVKNFRTVGDAAVALIFGNQTVLNEAKFHAQIGNHRIIVASALGVAAYLLSDFGYASETDLWLSYAKKDVEQFLLGRPRYVPLGSPPVSVQPQNVDGAFPEGIEYLNFSGRAFIPFMIAARVNGGEDYFQDANFKKLMEWSYALQLPDGSAPQINSTGYFAYPINFLMGTLYPEGSKYLGQLKRYVENTPAALDLETEAFSLLDSSAAAGPLSFAPITTLSSRGELIMRNNAAAPTRYVLVMAKNGPARFAAELHGYADAGSFLFQADGKTLVLHPGYAGYADSRELERAKSHNTVCPVVSDSVNDDAPNRDIASPPAADASITSSRYNDDFSYAALTMELYGSKAVNSTDEGLALYSAASSLPYEYGNSLHMTWKHNGDKYGGCDRKFLMVNNSYLVVRDDITRTNANMQYAVSYIHGNNGNNISGAAALSTGVATGAIDEHTWSADAKSPVLRVNTSALGGKIAAFSMLEAASHQIPDPALNPNAPRTKYFHAALRTACSFTNDYGQILSIVESDPANGPKSGITTKRNADSDAYVLYTVDGRKTHYGRYDVLFSQKQPKTITLANTGLPFLIETDASLLTVSFGGELSDSSGLKIFSNHATFIRCGTYTYVPNDTGDAQMSFTATHGATSVRSPITLPAAFQLEQNFPNPFNPSTTIRFGLPEESGVRLQIVNVLGQVVTDLVDGVHAPGWVSLTWNAAVPSGMYFYRLEAVSTHDPAKRFVRIRKMIVVK
jgi:hypothetical protein